MATDVRKLSECCNAPTVIKARRSGVIRVCARCGKKLERLDEEVIEKVLRPDVVEKVILPDVAEK